MHELLMGVISGLGVAAAAAIAFFLKGRSARNQGAEEQRNRDVKERERKMEKGRKSLSDGRSSGLSDADRVRKNTGKWY